MQNPQQTKWDEFWDVIKHAARHNNYFWLVVALLLSCCPCISVSTGGGMLEKISSVFSIADSGTNLQQKFLSNDQSGNVSADQPPAVNQPTVTPVVTATPTPLIRLIDRMRLDLNGQLVEDFSQPQIIQTADIQLKLDVRDPDGVIIPLTELRCVWQFKPALATPPTEACEQSYRLPEQVKQQTVILEILPNDDTIGGSLTKIIDLVRE